MNSQTLERRCRAHSSQTGAPCKRHPIKGGTVCATHGGSIRRVKRTAQERLAEMVDPLLTELFRIARSGESDAVRLAAIKDALDRAGYKPRDKIDAEVHQSIEVVYVDSHAGVSAAALPAAAASRSAPGPD